MAVLLLLVVYSFVPDIKASIRVYQLGLEHCGSFENVRGAVYEEPSYHTGHVVDGANVWLNESDGGLSVVFERVYEVEGGHNIDILILEEFLEWVDELVGSSLVVNVEAALGVGEGNLLSALDGDPGVKHAIVSGVYPKLGGVWKSLDIHILLVDELVRGYVDEVQPERMSDSRLGGKEKDLVGVSEHFGIQKFFIWLGGSGKNAFGAFKGDLGF